MDLQLVLLVALVASCYAEWDDRTHFLSQNGNQVTIPMEKYRALQERKVYCEALAGERDEYHITLLQPSDHQSGSRQKRSTGLEPIETKKQENLTRPIEPNFGYIAEKIEEYRQIGVPIALINNAAMEANVYALSENWLHVKNFTIKLDQAFFNLPVQIFLRRRDSDRVMVYTASYSKLQSNNEKDGSYLYVEDDLSKYEKIDFYLKEDGNLRYTLAITEITAFPPNVLLVEDPKVENLKVGMKSGPMVFQNSRSLDIEKFQYDAGSCDLQVLLTFKKEAIFTVKGDSAVHEVDAVDGLANFDLDKQLLQVSIPDYLVLQVYDVKELVIFCKNSLDKVADIKIPQYLNNWVLPHGWMEVSPPENDTFKIEKNTFIISDFQFQ